MCLDSPEPTFPESKFPGTEILPGSLAVRLLATTLAPLAALWTRAQERAIHRHGEPLPAAFHQAALELGVDPASVSIQVHKHIPQPLGSLLQLFGNQISLSTQAIGMALGSGINLAYAPQQHPELLLHELVHVRQYRQLGGHTLFLRRYLAQCLSCGYRDSPLEIEARSMAQALLPSYRSTQNS